MNIEHENTVRALKDESPLVNSVWCRFGIHRWTQWNKGQWIKDKDYSSIQHYVLNKRCVHCNTLKIKKVKGLVSKA